MITFVKIIFIYFWTAYFLVVNQCLRVFNHCVKLKTSFCQICLEIFNSIGTQINVNFLPRNQWVFPYIYLQMIAIFKRVSSHKKFLAWSGKFKIKDPCHLSSRSSVRTCLLPGRSASGPQSKYQRAFPKSTRDFILLGLVTTVVKALSWPPRRSWDPEGKSCFVYLFPFLWALKGALFLGWRDFKQLTAAPSSDYSEGRIGWAVLIEKVYSLICPDLVTD